MLILTFIFILSLISTHLFLPLLRSYGFLSKDINKLNSYTLIPEPGSIPSCLIYIITIFYLSNNKNGSNSIVISLFISLIIGIFDDFISLSWWSKILLPILCWMPSRYYVSRPGNIRLKLFKLIDYNIQISGYFIIFWEVITICIFIFIPNSINIYAGLNGLEVGQSLIITLAINGLGYLECGDDVIFYTKYFIPICMSLLVFNWYPAKLFVGDTFTFFAGILFANIYIIGYDLIKLMLFFLPQILNFLVSIPQLIGLVPCPRHRTPDIKNIYLLASNNNLTLINIILKYTGPLRERDIVVMLMVVQGIVGLATHLIVQ